MSEREDGKGAATVVAEAAPRRIQRQRTKGWRMPEGAVYVGRPSRWGNPFASIASIDLTTSLRLYRETAYGGWSPSILRGFPDDLVDRAYEASSAWRKRIGRYPAEQARYELRGRDLACWCPLDQPCHADVLLELANPPTPTGGG